MSDKHLGKIIARCKPEKSRKNFERLGGCRQRVGLLVADHLQAVLDPPQKVVGGREFVACCRVNPAVGGKRSKCRDGATIAQIGMSTAGDQLLRLHKEFDLTNAATAELYVVALHRDLAVAAIGMNLPFHFMDMRDRGVVEIFSPDKRR